MTAQISLVSVQRWILALMVVLAMIVSSRQPLGAQTAPIASATVTGAVKNASGEPVSGALVKVKKEDSGLLFMVVSQAQGRYTTPKLEPGKYSAQAFGGSYQSESSSPVEATADQPAKIDLTLSAPQKPAQPEKRRTPEDYEKLMPAGDGKAIVEAKCTLCHGVERVVLARYNRDDWQKTVDRMRLFIENRPDLQKQFHQEAMTPQETTAMVDYLVKNFGKDTPPLREEPPSDPNGHLPRTLLKGTEAKYVVALRDRRGRSEIYDVTVDTKGTPWVSGRDKSGGILGRYDRDSLGFTQVPLPPEKPTSGLGALAADPLDRIWMADRDPKNTHIWLYDIKSNEFKTYQIPAPEKLPPNVWRLYANLNTFRFLPDGTMWGVGNTSSRIVSIDPSTGKVADHPILSGSHPFGIAIGGDKAVWYAAMYTNEIVRRDTKTDQETRYKVPTPKAELQRMAADADGNLWIVEQDAGKLAKVDYRTGKITEHIPPSKDPGSYAIDVDRKHNLVWFDENLVGKLCRYDPRTSRFVEFALPTSGEEVRRMVVDPINPNRVWWSTVSKIGYIETVE